VQRTAWPAHGYPRITPEGGVPRNGRHIPPVYVTQLRIQGRHRGRPDQGAQGSVQSAAR